MIVFDVSTFVGAALRRDGVPELALRRAPRRGDQIGVSEAMMAELIEVLARPRLRRFLNPELRDAVLADLHACGGAFRNE